MKFSAAISQDLHVCTLCPYNQSAANLSIFMKGK